MKKVLIFSSALIWSSAWAGEGKHHPHLHKAHEAIEHAKMQLSKADDHKQTEFGGHRTKAVQLLDQAEQEVDAALAWAESNAK